MATGTLYRAPSRDAYGDPIDLDGNVIHVGNIGTEVGTIDGLVIGGPKWQTADARGDVVDTTGLVGIPVAEPAQPQHGDLLVVDGIRYTIQGPPQWAHANTLSGTPSRYRWFTITGTAN